MKKVWNEIYLANPAHIYMLVWTTTLFFFLLELTANIQELKYQTLFLIIGNIISFYLVIYYLANGRPIRRISLNREDVNLITLRSFAKKLLVFWFFGSLVDIYFSGGLPLIWSLSGTVGKNYTDFGIPSFHGVVNACYLLGSTCFFLEYLLTRNKKMLIFIIVLMCWPILMLGRGVLISLLMQFLSIYIILFTLSLKKLLKFFGFGLACIFFFGVVGDVRGDGNPFGYLVKSSSAWIFNNLPSGFLWVYLYLTTGINNINANIDVISPTYIPIDSVSNLIPSAMRDIYSEYNRSDSLVLVDNKLNTSSFYAGYLSDFGAIGAFIVVIFLQLVWAYFFLLSQKKEVSAILTYAIVLQCILLSVFYDLFMLLPYLFQIFIAQLYGKKLIKWIN